MRILAAFDSFKESMSAYEAGEAVREGAMDDEVIIHPMADGGEGTMEAINSALSGTIHELNVTGPDFISVTARLSIAQKIAVIESAQACGLEYLKEDEKDGYIMTSAGVGEMIAYALNQDVSQIYLTLGGTASNDGGMGMLSALGVSFSDEDGDTIIPSGQHLADVAAINRDQLDALLEAHPVRFTGICDVTNPLLGKNGATYVFGPQKGISKRTLPVLDAGMRHYAKLSAKVNHKDDSEVPGAGAAGGLGFALMSYLDGHLVKGVDEVIRLTHLEEAIRKADVVFTGEGKMDEQTLMGKTPYGVLKIAKKYHKPVIGFAGRVDHKEELLEAGFDDIRCINHTEEPLSMMLKEGKAHLRDEVTAYLKEHESDV